MSWTTEITSTIIEKHGQQSYVPSMVANGWALIASGSSSSSISNTLQREYVNFGSVLADMYELFTTEYATGKTNAQNTLETIVSFYDALVEAVDANVTNFDVSKPDIPDNIEGIDISYTINGVSADNVTFTPIDDIRTESTFSDITSIEATANFTDIKDVDVDANITSIIPPSAAIHIGTARANITKAKTEFGLKIKEATDYCKKQLSTYAKKLDNVGTDYNKDITNVLEILLGEFKAFESEVKNKLNTWGTTQRTRIELEFTTRESNEKQSFIDKGLWSSGTWCLISAGIEREKQIALNDLEDKILVRQLELANSLYANIKAVRDDFVKASEGMRGSELQAISIIIPKINDAADVLVSAYGNYLQVVGGFETQFAGMSIDSVLKVYDVTTQMARIEAELKLKKGELQAQVQQIRISQESAKSQFVINKGQLEAQVQQIKLSKESAESQFAINNGQLKLQVQQARTAQESAKAQFNINKANVDIANDSNAINAENLKINAAGVNASIMNANLGASKVSLDFENTRINSTDLKLRAETAKTGLFNALAAVHETYMRAQPTLSDIQACLGSAVAIESQD